jgi:hypothetical protein
VPFREPLRDLDGIRAAIGRQPLLVFRKLASLRTSIAPRLPVGPAAVFGREALEGHRTPPASRIPITRPT